MVYIKYIININFTDCQCLLNLKLHILIPLYFYLIALVQTAENFYKESTDGDRKVKETSELGVTEIGTFSVGIIELKERMGNWLAGFRENTDIKPQMNTHISSYWHLNSVLGREWAVKVIMKGGEAM